MDELFDLANTIGCTVSASAHRRIATGEYGYSVWMQMLGRSAEIMDNGLLRSVWGSGDSLDSAADDYLRQIEGCRIVFNPMSKSERFEFDVPARREEAHNAVR